MPEPIASITGLKLRAGAEPFDIKLDPGKVVGLAGLEGHGQGLFLEVLAGISRATEGSISVDGKVLDRGFRDVGRAYDAGLAYVPRDRKDEGLFLQLPVLMNFGLPTLSRVSRGGVIQRRKLVQRYEEYARDLGITAADEQAPIRILSGGNQQKVLLARWLAADPKILLLNDPSRGVDHGTKLSLQTIYRRVADSGSCVVLLSTEIEELLLTADETIVFREFGVSSHLGAEEMTRQNILAAMFGAEVG